MISNLDEINRLLYYFDQFGLESIEEETLLKELSSSPVVTQSSLDHRATVEFCVSAGLAEMVGGRARLTEAGEHLTELAKMNNPAHLIDFNPKECDFINRTVFLNPAFDSPIQATLRDYFDRDYYSRSWRYDYSEGEPLPKEFMEYVGVLKQSGLLREHSGLYEIDKRYSPLVSVLLSIKHSISQDELEDLLETQKETGQAAEKFVVDHEKKELTKIGALEEAKLVQRISEWDAAAGYDVESFGGPTTTKRHDKFIEVKGSTRRRLRFVWSANEIEKAKQLKDQYWLYFVGGIAKGKSPKLLKFRDPVRKVLNSPRFDTRSTGYLVTEAKGVKK